MLLGAWVAHRGSNLGIFGGSRDIIARLNYRGLKYVLVLRTNIIIILIKNYKRV